MARFTKIIGLCAGVALAGITCPALADPSPAAIYEVRIGGTTTDYTGPGSYSAGSTHASIVSSPLPTLQTGIDGGPAQDDVNIFLRYYFRINGPENVLVPVMVAGKIVLTASAPDTGQANAYGQLQLSTPFTSPTGFIEIDRGGEVRGSVSQLAVNLQGITYTNGWTAITMISGVVARSSSDGIARGSSYVDPIVSIDPSFAAFDPDYLQHYSISFTDGFGNGPVGVGAVPEPASWAMLLGGFGMIGGAVRRRRVATSFA